MKTYIILIVAVFVFSCSQKKQIASEEALSNLLIEIEENNSVGNNNLDFNLRVINNSKENIELKYSQLKIQITSNSNGVTEYYPIDLSGFKNFDENKGLITFKGGEIIESHLDLGAILTREKSIELGNVDCTVKMVLMASNENKTSFKDKVESNLVIVNARV